MTNLVPTRSLFTRFATRNPFICRACLGRGGAPRQPPWPALALAVARYSTAELAGLSSPAATQQTTFPDDATPQRAGGRKLSRTQSMRRQLRKTRDAQKPTRFLSKSEITAGMAEPTVRFFEQNKAGQVRQLADQDAFNDSFNNLPAFPDINEWFESLKNDEELSPFHDVIQAFQDGVTEQIDGVKDPEEKRLKLEAYMNALQEKVKDMEEDEDDAAELDALKRELESPNFLDGIDDFVEDDVPSRGEKGQTMRRRETTKESRVQKERPLAEALQARQKHKAPQIPKNPGAWSSVEWKKIVNLNQAMERRVESVQRGKFLTAKLVTSTWRTYYHMRLALIHNPKHVPADVWALLWDMITSKEDNIEVPNRMAHIARLAQDMMMAEVMMTPEQQLLAIEAIFITNMQQEAPEMFRMSVPTLGAAGSATFRDFWELGVRMYCRLRDTERAERAVARLLDRQFDARIMQPIIRAHAAKGTAEGDVAAWDMYRDMRERLGVTMKLEDYDEVIATFLANQQVERAFHTFVDMMTEGTVDLAARGEHVPPPPLLANKFFFGKWIKRLVLTGNLDGAHDVIRFMSRFAIKAAPIAVNTLIGAWHGMGGEQDFAKADEMAWEMIYSRINFVKIRALELAAVPSLPRPVRLKETVSDPEVVGTPSLPPANVETFLLLAEKYRSRGMHSRVIGLWNAMLDCELMPDTQLMNKLVNSYARENDVEGARRIYAILVREHHVPPDAYTFDTLWWLLGINRIRVLSEEARLAEIPAARALFAEVMAAAPALGPKMHDGLARIMLHTLRRLQDGTGIVVALRAMRKAFAFVPSDMLAVEMNAGSTDLSLETVEGRNRIRGGLRELVQNIRHMRMRARHHARAAGRARSELEDKPTGELIAMYLEARMLPRDVSEGEFWAVAEQMGAAALLKSGGRQVVEAAAPEKDEDEVSFERLEQLLDGTQEGGQGSRLSLDSGSDSKGPRDRRPEVDKLKELMHMMEP